MHYAKIITNGLKVNSHRSSFAKYVSKYTKYKFEQSCYLTEESDFLIFFLKVGLSPPRSPIQYILNTNTPTAIHSTQCFKVTDIHKCNRDMAISICLSLVTYKALPCNADSFYI